MDRPATDDELAPAPVEFEPNGLIGVVRVATIWLVADEFPVCIPDRICCRESTIGLHSAKAESCL